MKFKRQNNTKSEGEGSADGDTDRKPSKKGDVLDDGDSMPFSEDSIKKPPLDDVPSVGTCSSGTQSVEDGGDGSPKDEKENCLPAAPQCGIGPIKRSASSQGSPCSDVQEGPPPKTKRTKKVNSSSAFGAAGMGGFGRGGGSPMVPSYSEFGGSMSPLMTPPLMSSPGSVSSGSQYMGEMGSPVVTPPQAYQPQGNYIPAGHNIPLSHGGMMSEIQRPHSNNGTQPAPGSGSPSQTSTTSPSPTQGQGPGQMHTLYDLSAATRDAHSNAVTGYSMASAGNVCMTPSNISGGVQAHQQYRQLPSVGQAHHDQSPGSMTSSPPGIIPNMASGGYSMDGPMSQPAAYMTRQGGGPRYVRNNQQGYAVTGQTKTHPNYEGTIRYTMVGANGADKSNYPGSYGPAHTQYANMSNYHPHHMHQAATQKSTTANSAQMAYQYGGNGYNVNSCGGNQYYNGTPNAPSGGNGYNRYNMSQYGQYQPVANSEDSAYSQNYQQSHPNAYYVWWTSVNLVITSPHQIVWRSNRHLTICAILSVWCIIPSIAMWHHFCVFKLVTAVTRAKLFTPG